MLKKKAISWILIFILIFSTFTISINRTYNVYALPPAIIKAVSIGEIILTLFTGSGVTPMSPNIMAPLQGMNTYQYTLEGLVDNGVLYVEGQNKQYAMDNLGTGKIYDLNTTALKNVIESNWSAMQQAGLDALVSLENITNAKDIDTAVSNLGSMIQNLADYGYYGLENVCTVIANPGSAIQANFNHVAEQIKSIFSSRADNVQPVGQMQNSNSNNALNTLLNNGMKPSGIYYGNTSNPTCGFYGLPSGVMMYGYVDGNYFNLKLVNTTASSKSFKNYKGGVLSQVYQSLNSAANSTLGAYSTYPANSPQQIYFEGELKAAGNCEICKNVYDFNNAVSMATQGQKNVPQNPEFVDSTGLINEINTLEDDPYISTNDTISPVDLETYPQYINTVNNYITDGDYSYIGPTMIEYVNNYVTYGTPDNPAANVTLIPTPTYAVPVPVQPTSIPEKPPLEEEYPNGENPGMDMYAPDLTGKFPFCIVTDLVTAANMLKSTPEAPVISWRFQVERFDIDYTITLDFNPFNNVATLFRSLELILFIVGLAMATRYIIGA